MDMKVNQVLQAQQIEQVQQQQKADGSFKFTLASRVEESQLQERLTAMLEEITRQGDKLAKHRDVKDMKRGFSTVNLPESRLRCLRIGRIAFNVFYFI